MEIFSALGFRWDRSAVPTLLSASTTEKALLRFQSMMAEYVWDAAFLEDNPITLLKVRGLLIGQTIGGHRPSDKEQVLNLIASSDHLISLVKTRRFKLEKATFTGIHALVARNEALEWGHFRGEGPETNYTPDVSLDEHGRHTPLATIAGAPELNEVFANGLSALQAENPARLAGSKSPGLGL